MTEEDPKLLAYVLGELDESEEQKILQEIQNNPEAKNFAESYDQIASKLYLALDMEEIPAKNQSKEMKKVKGMSFVNIVTSVATIIMAILLLVSPFTISMSRESEERIRMARAESLYQEGREAKRGGNFEAAMKCWEQAIQASDKYLEPYIAKGDAFYGRHEYVNAIFEYDRALKIYPKNPKLYCRKGDCYMGRKEYDKAIEQYTEAINLNPKFADAYTKRAAAYQNRGKAEDLTNAIADFEKAATLTSGNK